MDRAAEKLLKKALNSRFSLYIKNYSPDMLNDWEMRDLVLNEQVLHERLRLPAVLQFKHIYCSSISVKVPWKNLSHEPIVFKVGTIEAVIVETKARKTRRRAAPSPSKPQQLSGPVSKRGFGSSIIDGVKIVIDQINISIETLGESDMVMRPRPVVSLNLSNVSIEATNADFKVADLAETRYVNKTTGELLVYKRVRVQQTTVSVRKGTRTAPVVNDLPFDVRFTGKYSTKTGLILKAQVLVVLRTVMLSITDEDARVLGAVLASFGMVLQRTAMEARSNQDAHGGGFLPSSSGTAHGSNVPKLNKKARAKAKATETKAKAKTQAIAAKTKAKKAWGRFSRVVRKAKESDPTESEFSDDGSVVPSPSDPPRSPEGGPAEKAEDAVDDDDVDAEEQLWGQSVELTSADDISNTLFRLTADRLVLDLLETDGEVKDFCRVEMGGVRLGYIPDAPWSAGGDLALTQAELQLEVGELITRELCYAPWKDPDHATIIRALPEGTTGEGESPGPVIRLKYLSRSGEMLSKLEGDPPPKREVEAVGTAAQLVYDEEFIQRIRGWIAASRPVLEVDEKDSAKEIRGAVDAKVDEVVASLLVDAIKMRVELSTPTVLVPPSAAARVDCRYASTYAVRASKLLLVSEAGTPEGPGDIALFSREGGLFPVGHDDVAAILCTMPPPVLLPQQYQVHVKGLTVVEVATKAVVVAPFDTRVDGLFNDADLIAVGKPDVQVRAGVSAVHVAVTQEQYRYLVYTNDRRMEAEAQALAQPSADTSRLEREPGVEEVGGEAPVLAVASITVDHLKVELIGPQEQRHVPVVQLDAHDGQFVVEAQASKFVVKSVVEDVTVLAPSFSSSPFHRMVSTLATEDSTSTPAISARFESVRLDPITLAEVASGGVFCSEFGDPKALTLDGPLLEGRTTVTSDYLAMARGMAWARVAGIQATALLPALSEIQAFTSGAREGSDEPPLAAMFFERIIHDRVVTLRKWVSDVNLSLTLSSCSLVLIETVGTAESLPVHIGELAFERRGLASAREVFGVTCSGLSVGTLLAESHFEHDSDLPLREDAMAEDVSFSLRSLRARSAAHEMWAYETAAECSPLYVSLAHPQFVFALNFLEGHIEQLASFGRTTTETVGRARAASSRRPQSWAVEEDAINPLHSAESSDGPDEVRNRALSSGSISMGSVLSFNSAVSDGSCVHVAGPPASLPVLSAPATVHARRRAPSTGHRLWDEPKEQLRLRSVSVKIRSVTGRLFKALGPRGQPPIHPLCSVSASTVSLVDTTTMKPGTPRAAVSRDTSWTCSSLHAGDQVGQTVLRPKGEMNESDPPWLAPLIEDAAKDTSDYEDDYSDAITVNYYEDGELGGPASLCQRSLVLAAAPFTAIYDEECVSEVRAFFTLLAEQVNLRRRYIKMQQNVRAAIARAVQAREPVEESVVDTGQGVTFSKEPDAPSREKPPISFKLLAKHSSLIAPAHNPADETFSVLELRVGSILLSNQREQLMQDASGGTMAIRQTDLFVAQASIYLQTIATDLMATTATSSDATAVQSVPLVPPASLSATVIYKARSAIGAGPVANTTIHMDALRAEMSVHKYAVCMRVLETLVKGMLGGSDGDRGDIPESVSSTALSSLAMTPQATSSMEGIDSPTSEVLVDRNRVLSESQDPQRATDPPLVMTLTVSVATLDIVIVSDYAEEVSLFYFFLDDASLDARVVQNGPASVSFHGTCELLLNNLTYMLPETLLSPTLLIISVERTPDPAGGFTTQAELQTMERLRLHLTREALRQLAEYMTHSVFSLDGGARDDDMLSHFQFIIKNSTGVPLLYGQDRTAERKAVEDGKTASFSFVNPALPKMLNFALAHEAGNWRTVTPLSLHGTAQGVHALTIRGPSAKEGVLERVVYVSIRPKGLKRYVEFASAFYLHNSTDEAWDIRCTGPISQVWPAVEARASVPVPHDPSWPGATFQVRPNEEWSWSAPFSLPANASVAKPVRVELVRTDDAPGTEEDGAARVITVSFAEDTNTRALVGTLAAPVVLHNLSSFPIEFAFPELGMGGIIKASAQKTISRDVKNQQVMFRLLDYDVWSSPLSLASDSASTLVVKRSPRAMASASGMAGLPVTQNMELKVFAAGKADGARAVYLNTPFVFVNYSDMLLFATQTGSSTVVVLPPGGKQPFAWSSGGRQLSVKTANSEWCAPLNVNLENVSVLRYEMPDIGLRYHLVVSVRKISGTREIAFTPRLRFHNTSHAPVSVLINDAAVTVPAGASADSVAYAEEVGLGLAQGDDDNNDNEKDGGASSSSLSTPGTSTSHVEMVEPLFASSSRVFTFPITKDADHVAKLKRPGRRAIPVDVRVRVVDNVSVVTFASSVVPPYVLHNTLGYPILVRQAERRLDVYCIEPGKKVPFYWSALSPDEHPMLAIAPYDNRVESPALGAFPAAPSPRGGRARSEPPRDQALPSSRRAEKAEAQEGEDEEGGGESAALLAGEASPGPPLHLVTASGGSTSYRPESPSGLEWAPPRSSLELLDSQRRRLDRITDVLNWSEPFSVDSMQTVVVDEGGVGTHGRVVATIRARHGSKSVVLSDGSTALSDQPAAGSSHKFIARARLPFVSLELSDERPDDHLLYVAIKDVRCEMSHGLPRDLVYVTVQDVQVDNLSEEPEYDVVVAVDWTKLNRRDINVIEFLQESAVYEGARFTEYVGGRILPLVVKVDGDLLSALRSLKMHNDDGRLESASPTLPEQQAPTHRREGSASAASERVYIDAVEMFAVEMLLCIGDNSADLPVMRDGVGVQFAHFARSNLYERPEQVVTELAEAYRSQSGWTDVGRFVASLDAFGNPLGAIARIKDGCWDFIYLPWESLVLDDTRGAVLFGIARGTASLLKNTTDAFLMSAYKLTSSLSWLCCEGTFDPDYKAAKIRMRRRHPPNVFVGFYQGAQELGYGVFMGFAGLVLLPYKGALAGGATGAVVGVGKGIIGVPTKIIGGLFDFVGKTLEGLKNSTGTGFIVQRRCERPPPEDEVTPERVRAATLWAEANGRGSRVRDCVALRFVTQRGRLRPGLLVLATHGFCVMMPALMQQGESVEEALAVPFTLFSLILRVDIPRSPETEFDIVLHTGALDGRTRYHFVTEGDREEVLSYFAMLFSESLHAPLPRADVALDRYTIGTVG